jgi:predicted transcriptional regulator
MTLSEYLLWNEMTLRQFSAVSGVSISSLSKIIKGKQYPAWPTMQRIEKATSGLVQAKDYEVENASIKLAR